MKISELFIDLSIHGTGEARAALGEIKQGTEFVAWSATKAVATITTLIYGLKKLQDQSDDTGFGLSQFSQITGESNQILQRWQQLGLKAGVATDEITKSVVDLQAKMLDLVAFGKAPDGFPLFLDAMARMGKPIDTNKFRDIYYMLGKIREFAHDFKGPADIRERVLAGLVSGTAFRQALKTSAVNLEDIDPTRIYSERQIKTLTNLHNRWMDLINKIEVSFGKSNARFGPGILKDIEGLTSNILDLVNAFAKLNEQLHILMAVGKIFQGWGLIAQLATETINSQKKISPKYDPNVINKYQPEPSLLLQRLQTAATYVTNTFHIEGKGSPDEIATAIKEHLSIVHNNAFRQIPNANTGGGS